MASPIDVSAIRSLFPVLSRQVKGHPLVYLDNAATSQKPVQVIDALTDYYRNYNANIHRGIHSLAEEATSAYEAARDAAKGFINAAHREEVVFTKGTTEGINLLAYTWGRQNLKHGDEILVSAMEHHSNIVPWQMLCLETGSVIKVIPVNDQGELMMDKLDELLTERTRLVSIVHISNALGTINPVAEIITKAHGKGAVVLLDGAQSAVHLNIDVQQLDCDFFVCSSHKVYGPTGVGIFYGKKHLLEAMPPFHGGGEMIREVSFSGTTYNELPYKLEAGTPNMADVIAFRAAIDFVNETGKEAMILHEQQLLDYATSLLLQIDGLRIIGTAKEKASVISFVIDKVHPQDIGVLLDNKGIAVRTGNHCAQPLMECFGIRGTIRASFAVYNTMEEVDLLGAGLNKALKMLL
ncbi:MAG: cysteine desulfurase [Sphingobacteriales bacterium]|nr:MAG: cysteine desulfurase [Sphingobacteriales bacterium]